MILFILISIFIIFLIIERHLINRQINSIPLRITVAGTRGKSSVVDLMASILRESGRVVLSKTTGSEARYILPDGKCEEVKRRGSPSIIEQKKLIRKAFKINASTLITEIMSITGENHYIESQKIIRPHIVLFTNIRVDHTEAMGKDKKTISSVFAHDIVPDASVYIPEEEARPQFWTAAQKNGARLITVKRGTSSSVLSNEFCDREFRQNLDLVVAAARDLNIDEKSILNGISKTKHDIGSLKIWKLSDTISGKELLFVNGFSVNDPESTLLFIEKIKKLLPVPVERFIGLLNLRKDRADRTLQWIDAIKKGQFPCFSTMYVTGAHLAVVKRKLKRVKILKDKRAEKIINRIKENSKDEGVVIGIGNIAGMGRSIVKYLESRCCDYGI